MGIQGNGKGYVGFFLSSHFPAGIVDVKLYFSSACQALYPYSKNLTILLCAITSSLSPIGKYGLWKAISSFCALNSFSRLHDTALVLLPPPQSMNPPFVRKTAEQEAATCSLSKEQDLQN